MLRVGLVSVGGAATAAAHALRDRGIVVRTDPAEPVALSIAVVLSGGSVGGEAADAVLTVDGPETAARAAAELHRARLAPWIRAMASERPDVTAPPHLLGHDPCWAGAAARRGRALRQVLAALDRAGRLGLRRIDHIGSTAVPGLAAKPYLDLQVTLDRLPDLDVLAPALAPLGWAPAIGARPDSPGVHRDLRHDDDTAPDGAYVKRLFVAPDPVRPAILHVRLTASPFARRVVRFRDRLRADPRLRRDYERMKRQAAAAHAGDEDYDDYTRDKGSWLADAYRGVDAWAEADDPWPRDR